MLNSIIFSLRVDSVRVDSNRGSLVTSPAFSKEQVIEELVEKLYAEGYAPDDISKIQFIIKDGYLYLEGMALEMQEHLV
jgi:hypothetical protein